MPLLPRLLSYFLIRLQRLVRFYVQPSLARLRGSCAHHHKAKMPPNLPHLKDVDVLSPRVIRVLGLNPGSHTLQGTNTYIVGTGRKRILLDTGEGRQRYPQVLQEAMEAAGVEAIQEVLLTHHHYDHANGLEQVRALYGPEVPAWKRLHGCTRSGVRAVAHVEDGAVFTTEGATLRAIYTPGHTDDHISFWLDEEQALFSGDCILGHGTTVFDDLYDYMASLRRLLDMSRAADGSSKLQHIYPGHGDVIKTDPVGVIEEYIVHRNKREEQVYEALAGMGARGLTSLQIVEVVYENLDPGVVISAQWNVEHHLNKLGKEGKVSESFGLWRAKDAKPLKTA